MPLRFVRAFTESTGFDVAGAVGAVMCSVMDEGENHAVIQQIVAFA